MALFDKLKSLAGKLVGSQAEAPAQKTEEAQEEVQQSKKPTQEELRSASIKSGQALSDSLETLKASLPQYKWLGEERVRVLTITIDTIQKMIGGQHADLDVSGLDTDMQNIVEKSIPFLLSAESLYQDCLHALKGLIDAVRSRVGTENEIKAAKVKTKIIVLEIEEKKLASDWQMLDAQRQSDESLLTAESAKLSSDPRNAAQLERVNNINSGIDGILAQMKSIDMMKVAVASQLSDLKRENTLLDIEKGTVSGEVGRAISTTIEEYQKSLVALHKKALEIADTAIQQRAKIDATVHVIRDEQKEHDFGVTLTQSAAERLKQMNEQQTQTVTNNAQTETNTETQPQVLYEEN